MLRTDADRLLMIDTYRLEPEDTYELESDCLVPGCRRPHCARGFCRPHYYSQLYDKGLVPSQQPKTTCAVDGCNRRAEKRSWCNAHYIRWRKHGDPTVVLVGRERRRWTQRPLRPKRLAFRTAHGYIRQLAPEHHEADARGYVMQHRLVMEAVLGRALLRDEEVHHKNLIRSDNHPSNLELWMTSQPPGARVADLVEWAKSLLLRYAPEALAFDTYELGGPKF